MMSRALTPYAAGHQLMRLRDNGHLEIGVDVSLGPTIPTFPL
jgi:hypothetical protein